MCLLGATPTQGATKVRAGCHCTECEQRRTLKRRKSKLTRMGRALRVNPTELARTVTHVRHMMSLGMSTSLIADESATSTKIISQLNKGTAKGMNRATFERIMRVEAKEPVSFPGRHGGSRMPTIGSARRVRALYAQGFGFSWWCRQLGVRNHVSLLDLVYDRKSYISYRLHQRIKEVYKEYCNADPLEHGMTRMWVSRNKNAARHAKYPGVGCWDEDTIDDPATEPEWTGACGTPRGYWMHRQFRLPMCGRCREAHERENTDDRSKEAAA